MPISFSGTYFSLPVLQIRFMKEAPKNKDKKTGSKKGKTLKEKIQRHLADKNDVITEQDLKEVIVGVDAVDLDNPDEPSIQADDVHPKEKITPWDVLDEKE
jgi:hypothetical protein